MIITIMKNAFLKNKILNFIFIVFCFVLIACFSGCSRASDKIEQSNNGKINVATTNFPLYDFVRQVASENVNLKMLIAPGVDMHSFEPSAETIRSIENADVLIYLGGEEDSWVEKVLGSISDEKKNKIKQVNVTQSLSYDSPRLNDSHVWTSLRASIKVVQILQSVLSQANDANAAVYSKNSELFISKLSSLKEKFAQVVADGKRKVLVFGGKFPFRPFANEFGLKVVAAFNNCSSKSEASSHKVFRVVDFVKQNRVPMVLKSDFDEGGLAEVIAGEASVKVGVFNSCHTISAADFSAGKTYLDFMEQNLETLKEALN